jgi:ribosomal protein L40E
MSAEKTTNPTKLCPTCGTRLSQDATRCLVCGTNLATPSVEKSSRPARGAVQGSRMPEITLSLPAALGLLALFLTIGAVLVYLASIKALDKRRRRCPHLPPRLLKRLPYHLRRLLLPPRTRRNRLPRRWLTRSNWAIRAA